MNFLVDDMPKARQVASVPREHIIFDRELGHGEFGVVMHAFVTGLSNTSGVVSVAVKMLKERVSSTVYDEFISEGQRHRDLNHVNVVRLMGTCLSDPPLLLFEFMSNGDLCALLRKCRLSNIELRVEHLLKITIDVCRGFAYLQQRRFVHRDLAARNVLVSGTFEAKIGDLGLLFITVVDYRFQE